MPSDEIDGFETYVGTLSDVPIDLESEALDSEGAACHVCDAVASVLVQMLDPASDVGSAIYLCDQDFELVTQHQVEQLAERMAANYSVSAGSCRTTANAMTTGAGRSVRLPQPERPR